MAYRRWLLVYDNADDPENLVLSSQTNTSMHNE
jgi:hypothetical protein